LSNEIVNVKKIAVKNDKIAIFFIIFLLKQKIKNRNIGKIKIISFTNLLKPKKKFTNKATKHKIKIPYSPNSNILFLFLISLLIKK